MYTIKNVLKENYQKWYNKPYIYAKKEGKYEYKTFGQLIEDTIYLAEYLKKSNLKNHNIIIYGENSYEWLVSDLAIAGFCGISIGVDKEWKEKAVSDIINRIDASAIIYSETKQEVINNLKEKYPDVEYVCMQKDLNRMIAEGKIINQKRENMFDLDGQNVEKGVKIILSSGTTGRPKAVLLSQKNIFSNWRVQSRVLELDENDSYYVFLPFHHVYAGVALFMNSLIMGISIYLCFDKKKMVEEVLEVNPTIFTGVPLIYHRYYEQVNGDITKLKNFFGKNIKYLYCGGANFDKKIKEDYIRAGLDLVESYGMTEGNGVVSFQKSTLENMNTVGTIIEEVEAKVINPDEFGYGELLIKGEGVFLEYYGEPELTNQAKDEEGFYHTGDIVCMKDNELYYKKRKDRMIVTINGENIDPSELENLIMNLGGNINKVKVYLEEKDIKAILYTNYELDGEKIIANANKRLPKYKHIRRWELIEDSLDVRYK